MIEFRGVSKSYRGSLGRTARALTDLSFRIEPGECFAIVGPNGAGKSTILGLILGYLRPDAGEVRVHGRAPRAYAKAHGIGYLPERVELPGWWSVPGALRRLGTLDGLRGRELAARRRAAIERVELAEHAGKRIKALSKGNLQRVGIAQLLLRPRAVILMDEPASGLDPMWRARFRDLLGELRRDDPARTIVISSHDLPEIERVADRVALIDAGRLREIVDLRRAPERPDILIRVSGPVRLGEYLPAAIPTDGGWRVPEADPAELSRALALFLGAGGILEALVPEAPSLEQVVRRAFADGRDGRGARTVTPAPGGTSPAVPAGGSREP